MIASVRLRGLDRKIEPALVSTGAPPTGEERHHRAELEPLVWQPQPSVVAFNDPCVAFTAVAHALPPHARPGCDPEDS